MYQLPSQTNGKQRNHQLINFSKGDASSKLDWMNKKAPDGKAKFEYSEKPKAHTKKPKLDPAPPYMHNTPPFGKKKKDND